MGYLFISTDWLEKWMAETEFCSNWIYTRISSRHINFPFQIFLWNKSKKKIGGKWHKKTELHELSRKQQTTCGHSWAKSEYPCALFSLLKLFTTHLRPLTTLCETFWKHCGKRRKCWLPAFSPFPTMVSTLPKTKFNFCHIYFVVCRVFQIGPV